MKVTAIISTVAAVAVAAPIAKNGLTARQSDFNSMLDQYNALQQQTMLENMEMQKAQAFWNPLESMSKQDATSKVKRQSDTNQLLQQFNELQQQTMLENLEMQKAQAFWNGVGGKKLARRQSNADQFNQMLQQYNELQQQTMLENMEMQKAQAFWNPLESMSKQDATSKVKRQSDFNQLLQQYQELQQQTMLENMEMQKAQAFWNPLEQMSSGGGKKLARRQSSEEEAYMAAQKEMFAAEMEAQNKMQEQTTEEEFAQKMNDAAWQTASGGGKKARREEVALDAELYALLHGDEKVRRQDSSSSNAAAFNAMLDQYNALQQQTMLENMEMQKAQAFWNPLESMSSGGGSSKVRRQSSNADQFNQMLAQYNALQQQTMLENMEMQKAQAFWNPLETMSKKGATSKVRRQSSNADAFNELLAQYNALQQQTMTENLEMQKAQAFWNPLEQMSSSSGTS